MKDADVQEMLDRGTNVVAKEGGGGGGGGQVAFAPPRATSQLKVRWAKIKRRIGNGSAPDESLGEPTNTTDATSNDGSSVGAGGRRWGRRGSKDGIIAVGGQGEEKEEKEDMVDEVVVEATGSPEYWKASAQPGGGSQREGGGGTSASPGTALQGTGMQSEGSSLRATAYDNASGIIGTAGNFVRYRVWPKIVNFFEPRYHDPEVEEAYQKELWYTGKSTTIFGSCFLVFSWVLAISLLPHPWSTFNKVNNYALGPVLSIPLVVMAAFDFPRRHKWLWQIWVVCCTWMSAAANVIDMHVCEFYLPTRHCANRDFMGTLYYCSAGPVIALFALNQRRIIMFSASLAWILLVFGLIIPSRPSFIRNILNVALFQGFVLFIHYMQEMGSRRMYTLRAELKVQFRAKQKSQINERKAMDSKRRFSSYIFHEVRVPLNTALLAVQNLEGANVFDKNSEQAVEYAALEGSLQMMSQVLNDVLDFSRMERGGFSSVSRPFSFHNVMRSIFVPLRIDTNARGLLLETSLDPRIDEVARKAAFPEEDGAIVQEGDGIMLGDEMRLRQVINNLASNAAKFTSAGGKITIRTTLVYPHDGLARYDAAVATNNDTAHSDTTSATATHSPRLSQNRLLQHEAKTSEKREGENVLVARIEITDTGVGIRSRDMAESRLFSAYVQTEIGRKQGGKGTGLGLSLVRQIVMLSGGRLGVKSKVGQGSTFWVEMPFVIGTEVRSSDHLEPHRRVSSTLDKELNTPSASSEPSDYRFLPSLTSGAEPRRTSDPTLSSIGEGNHSEIEMTPTHYRFSSPPGSPALQAPAAFIPMDGMTPPLTSTPRLGGEPRLGGDSSQTSTLQGGSDLLRRPSFPPRQENLSSSSAPPALPPPPTPAPAKRSQELEFPDGPLRVLIVDDDALTRRLMGRMMQRLGCKVSFAENGAVALDMLLAHDESPSGSEDGIDPRSSAPQNYDITFLDNQMPVMSGLGCVNRLRSLGRDDLVCGVTANALISDQQDYIEQGATAVLTKPVLEGDLRRFLIMADRRRSERKNGSGRPTPSGTIFPPPVLLRTREDD